MCVVPIRPTETLNGRAGEGKWGKYIQRRKIEKEQENLLVLFVVFATIVSGRVLPFGRWGWRKTTLPLGHEIRGGTLEFRGGQLGDGRPGNAFGDAGIGRGRTRVPLAKARGSGRQRITRLS